MELLCELAFLFRPHMTCSIYRRTLFMSKLSKDFSSKILMCVQAVWFCFVNFQLLSKFASMRSLDYFFPSTFQTFTLKNKACTVNFLQTVNKSVSTKAIALFQLQKDSKMKMILIYPAARC